MELVTPGPTVHHHKQEHGYMWMHAVMRVHLLYRQQHGQQIL